MNRSVSLLLVALSLAAASLAQPAQAQQAIWTRGLPYFLSSNTQNSYTGTTVTATINNSATGHVNITANPTNSNPGYTTSGSYSGSVGVYYTWGGGSIASAMTLSTTQSLEATGAVHGNENASSSAGVGGPGQPVASGQSSYSTAGWDTTASAFYIYYYAAGTTPPSVNQVTPLSGSINPANYDSSNPGQSIVTADVTFSQPTMTQ